ncbi:bifunctional diguanylate cyclase/phosphodiesterase [Baekduia sp.]|uniref:putative bifunctional diguanylate cyclase/phosphodiesterase n=1 Tax=Baekduia sp. TaxID=2600305 RepID=UPI002E04B0CF|nr:bifunctional diguanylate cyclase/phosphodiesterase [Baekduia sp.]
MDDVRTTEHDCDKLREAAIRLQAAEARAEAAEQGLRHQTLHDPLTQLPNRALLLDRLRLAVARRRRAKTWVAVLYLDVDDFKGINDSLGQAAGDEFLRTLAPRLSQVLRPSDTLARLGGDEFAILCEGLDEVTESAAIAERLLAVVAQPVEIAGVQLLPSASIGIALTGPGAVNDGEDLLRDGGVAMYRARAGGHGRYEIFDDRMRAETVERVALTRDLRRAIEDGDLRLVYQPMVRFAEGRAHAVEALARWTHPERGEIPPDRFISLAEQHGLIEPLGRWVLHEAVDQLRRWRDAGLPMGEMEMSINVSRVQLSRRGLAEQIFEVLAEREIPTRQLVVEVTESAVMDDPAVANATLDALAQAGVRIALDDFGVGQSSLACLRDLPLDALKLDRGFITSLASSRQSAAIVRAVCDMARTLNFSVVAEGVETGAQSQVVEALGCDIGQGFLYARPVPPQEIPAVVAELDRRLGTSAPAADGTVALG